MSKNLKVGILKETKTPPDKRVALTPDLGKMFKDKFPDVNLVIQSSDNRCFTDKEYLDKGFTVVDDVNDCDILIGVKEVKIEKLIPNKKYLFFSHTAKKQPYNRDLLKAFINKNIQIIDHEYLTDKNNQRLVAFGYWAGLVGAYNGLYTYGKKYSEFNLKRAIECHDLNEINDELKKVNITKPIKILITGGGRVAHGAMETLNQSKISKVTPQQFLEKTFNYPVYTQIDPWDYAKRKDGSEFDLEHFFKHPEMYESTFLPYTKVTNLFIACHFWDPKSPVFMTDKDLLADDFKIDIIADVSCDIGKPIPSTIRASTIANPIYGYDPKLKAEVNPFDKGAITVMAVDNLPGEIPRNSSHDFGKGLIEKVYESLFYNDADKIIERASITKDGKLTPTYEYLQDFVDGK